MSPGWAHTKVADPINLFDWSVAIWLGLHHVDLGLCNRVSLKSRSKASWDLATSNSVPSMFIIGIFSAKNQFVWLDARRTQAGSGKLATYTGAVLLEFSPTAARALGYSAVAHLACHIKHMRFENSLSHSAGDLISKSCGYIAVTALMIIT